MVVFVGHTLLLSSVGLDINNISNTVVGEVCGQLDGAMFYNPSTSAMFKPAETSPRTLEAPLEHVTRTRPVTEGVRHLED